MFGPLETQIMDIVWASKGPVAVREVVDKLNRRRPDQLAYTTVMTVMTRLTDKEVLTRVRKGRGYVYEAVAPDAAGLAVRGVLQEFGNAALAHFAEEARSDPKSLKRLRKLLEEA